MAADQNFSRILNTNGARKATRNPKRSSSGDYQPSAAWAGAVGITVIFLVMLALLAASWFIKYPDILVAEVVITSDPAPVTLVTRVPGRITLLKRDKEKCEAGEVIGYIQSNANVGGRIGAGIQAAKRLVAQPHA